MKNLIALSIRRPVFAWILMSAFIIFGGIALSRMGVSQLPDVDFPVISISVSYDGAAPQVIETEILEPLEERLLAIEGIKEMKSSARAGQGSISLDFSLDRNVDVVLQEVQTALGRWQPPQGVDAPTIRKQNPEEDPILILSVYGGKDIKEMLDWTNNFLLDQIRFLEGVGEVSVGGFSERNLRIWIDTQKLEKYYLTISDVVQALNTQHVESAAGQFSDGKRELQVRWMGEATTVEEVENIRILQRGGQRIFEGEFRIKDVARVEDGLSDIRRLARIDGQQAVAMQIRKQRGTNEVEIAKAIRERLEKIKPQFPPGYNYFFNVDFTKPTESTVNLTMEKLVVAALVTILICFLFLGSIQAAINILFSIPTSIVGTFLILYFSGFTLNLFTLLALTLAVSIVVDDAIMLLENIVRHHRMGKSAAQAAYDGSVEILPAAIAATLAVVAVFLPVVVLDGVIGKFFFQFGIAMSAAVLLSLVEAITITPMRAAAFLQTSPKSNKMEIWLDDVFHRLGEKYSRVVAAAMNKKWTVILASTAFFVGSLYMIKLVKKEFVPAQDQDFIILTAQAPVGSALQVTDQFALKIEEILRKEPNIEGFFTSVGAGGPSASVNQIFMPIVLKPKAERELTHLEVMDKLRPQFKDLKGLRVNMRDISARNLTSGRQNPLAISLRGPDLNVLEEKSKELADWLEEQGLGVDMDTDYRRGVPELLVEPNRQAMAARGVSVEAVGQILAAGVGGFRLGRFTKEGDRFDIRFKFDETQIREPKDFKSIYVRNTAGNLIPLSELVTLKEGSAIQTIQRVNRLRAISVFGNIAPGKSQAEVLGLAQQHALKILPTGYSAVLEGASAGFSQAFSGLTQALLIGLLVAYMILAIQFNSFIHPITVLIALPFSISGAFLALWIFGASLNLFSFIGLIVLMGIAKKNSILLVEFANQVRERSGKNVFDAMVEAGAVRLRPILMTSVATVAAAIPLVLGSGLGSETRVPLGLSIIGGTIVSTILTLIVVPSIYLALSKLERNKEIDLKIVSK
ncbi:MAG: efflux RND transporter permease subunit [Pseudobdellovibrionaceae bacterium]